MPAGRRTWRPSSIPARTRRRASTDASRRCSALTDSPLRLVAIDLGAESGRVVVGTFDGGRLALQDVHRFANVPVTLAGTLHWDFLRLFGDVTAGLRRAAAGGPVASVGVDTWGVDFGFLDDRGRLLGNPVHHRDARTAGMPDLAFATVPREEIYRATGIQFMPINTLFQLLSMARAGERIQALARACVRVFGDGAPAQEVSEEVAHHQQAVRLL